MIPDNALVIWGAGGHGKVVVDLAHALGWTRIFFLDDYASPGSRILGYEVRHTDALANQGRTPSFIIAIGDNRVRAHCFRTALAWGWQPASLIHPTAIVSPHSRIGAGTLVMPRTVINACTVVGSNCIINTAAVIEHDCAIGDHVHIAPSATLAGNVSVGEYAQISLHACVLPGKSIGKGALVGAGAVVTTTVEQETTVVGVPARVLAAGKPTSHAQ